MTVTFHTPRIYLLFLAACMSLIACSDEADQGKTASPPVVAYKKEKDSSSREKSPIISISDTLAPPIMVLCMKDSAANSQRLGDKLFGIYNKISEVIGKNKIGKAGYKMAWYKKNAAPYFFEAGIPVTKRPASLPKKMYIKKVGGTNVVIAHYYGPYSLTFQAYETLREWLKDSNKKQTGAPYEIYVNEPYDSNGKPIDPYAVRTDIVFPHD